MTSARETALAAREVALEAARVRAEEEAAAERAAQEERVAEERAKCERARETIAMSPLGEWFPGEEWLFSDFSSKGTAIGVAEGDGRDVVVMPVDGSFRLLLEREKLRTDLVPEGRVRRPLYEETGKVKVYAVERKADVGMSTFNTGYDYWDGPEVKSPADVGDWIAAQESRTR